MNGLFWVMIMLLGIVAAAWLYERIAGPVAVQEEYPQASRVVFTVELGPPAPGLFRKEVFMRNQLVGLIQPTADPKKFLYLIVAEQWSDISGGEHVLHITWSRDKTRTFQPQELLESGWKEREA